MPGLVDVHTHLAAAGGRAAGDDDDVLVMRLGLNIVMLVEMCVVTCWAVCVLARAPRVASHTLLLLASCCSVVMCALGAAYSYRTGDYALAGLGIAGSASGALLMWGWTVVLARMVPTRQRPRRRLAPRSPSSRLFMPLPTLTEERDEGESATSQWDDVQ